MLANKRSSNRRNISKRQIHKKIEEEKGKIGETSRKREDKTAEKSPQAKRVCIIIIIT